MRAFAYSLVLLFALAPAHGQVAEMPDATVQKAMRLALRQIHRVPCGGLPCAPATEAEMETPPLAADVARRVIAAGTLAGPARWCGEDWQQRLFGPMMAHLSRGGGEGPRGVALGSLLFGIYQGQAAGPLAGAGPCPPEVKAALAAQIAAFPAWETPAP